MCRLAAAIFVCLLGAPAAAQSDGDPLCDGLWFARNVMFHQAGYCFGSPLGQAVFGTEGCTGTDIALPPAAADLAATIRSREADYGCAIDTTRRSLSLRNMEARMGLTDQPVDSEGESACIGWAAPPKEVLSGWRADARVTGTIEAGAYVFFGFEDHEGWSFVEVKAPDTLALQFMGWVRLGPHDPAMCEAWAG